MTAVSDDAKFSIFALLLQETRERTFQYYESVKHGLAAAELRVHLLMDPDMERLISDKQCLLLQRLAKDAGVGDEGLFALMCCGVKLTGVGGKSPLFADDEDTPTLTDVQLMNSSRWSCNMILGKAGTDEGDVRKEIWESALEEVRKGWLQGLFTIDELKNKLGPLFVISKRFGLRQADKVRPIDDLSQSLVNSAFASSYKLDLSGADGFAILARTILECVNEKREVCLQLSDGSWLHGTLHDSITLDQARDLRGRTLDLDAAYKQMLVAKPSLWTSVLAIEDIEGHKRLFLSRVLPFGASASVCGFNRVVHALHCIGERLFGLAWCNFYDDCPPLDLAICDDDAQKTAERLFELVGNIPSKRTRDGPMIYAAMCWVLPLISLGLVSKLLWCGKRSRESNS